MSKIKIFSLGGLNENGKNMYVVEVDKDIFVFDAGLKYGNDQMLGIDYILPDYSYLIENEKRIKGKYFVYFPPCLLVFYFVLSFNKFFSSKFKVFMFSGYAT